MKKSTFARAFAYSFLAGVVVLSAKDIDFSNMPVGAGDRLIENVKALRSGLKESMIGEPLPQQETEQLLYYADMG